VGYEIWDERQGEARNKRRKQEVRGKKQEVRGRRKLGEK
jgi:hypothetical protein